MWPSAIRGVPLSYIARNLWVRRVTTMLTALGMALVVYVFATVLMMSEGIKATLVATGQADNVMVLPKRGSGKPSNVTVRGTSETGLALRPQVRLVLGRMFREGSSEIVTGSAIARGFSGAALGETLRFAGREWTVVGIFDAGRTGFDSEIWGDAEQMMQAFRRNAYSSVVFRLADAQQFARVRSLLDGDPRLTLDAKPER